MKNQAIDLYDTLMTLAWYFNSQCCSDSNQQQPSTVDFLALRCIHKHRQCPVNAISKALGMTKSGATRITRRLEEQGLINIGNSMEDGRLRCLTLTRQGQQCMDSIIQTQSQKLLAHLETIGEQSSQELLNGLATLMQNLDAGPLHCCTNPPSLNRS